jgi:hypothetical protein
VKTVVPIVAAGKRKEDATPIAKLARGAKLAGRPILLTTSVNPTATATSVAKVTVSSILILLIV